MNTLSLFDGISAGQVALNRAMVRYNNYYASEIDKHAIKITQTNYPDTIQLGSVLDWKKWKVNEKIDLAIAGFPCQPYSISGKRKGLEDERGGNIVNAMIDIIEYYQPNEFLLENVKGLLSIDDGNTFRHILKALNNVGYAVDWFTINSNLVSAQNRDRLYIVGKKLSGCNNYSIHLDEKNTRTKQINLFGDGIESGSIDRAKSLTITASYKNSPQPYEYTEQKRKQMIIVDRQKSHCIDANYYKGASYEQYQTKSRKQLIGQVQIDSGSVEWRKLTPIECERLQTFEDNFTAGVSPTQRYKCLGNSWTVDVIAHILQQMEI